MLQQMDIMKMAFYSNLSQSTYETPAREKERTLTFSDAEYSYQMQMVKGIKQTVRSVGACESLFSYKLDVDTVNGRDRLVLRANDDSGSFTIYVPTSEMFDIIHSYHSAMGHGVPRIPDLHHVLNTTYANITEGAVAVYLKLCKKCSKSKCVDSKTMGPCEDLAPEKSRGILDIIDVRDEKSTKYQYVMCYTVTTTNFLLLKPLENTSVKEIASRLIDAFAVLGTPIILHSTMDSIEFNDGLINTLNAEWPDAKVVRGRPTERITETVMKQRQKLRKLMEFWVREISSSRGDTSEWPNSLNWVQFRMNSNPDVSSMEFTPFEMMFGQPAFQGLSSVKIDDQNSSNYHYEEDISHILKHSAGGVTNISHTEYPIVTNQLPADDYSGKQNSTEQSNILAAKPVPIFKRPMNSVPIFKRPMSTVPISKRPMSTVPISNQPMNTIILKRWNSSDGDIPKGTRVLISAFQKCFPKLNLAGLLKTIVIEYQANLYMLGTSKGVINYKFHRKHLTPCNNITPIDVNLYNIISMHEAFGTKLCRKGARVAKCETAECPCEAIGISCENRNHGRIPSSSAG